MGLSGPTARHRRIEAFLRRCAATLDGLADGRPTREAAAALSSTIDRWAPQRFDPGRVPALDSLDRLPAGAEGAHPEPGLVRAFLDIVPDLAWVPTTRADDGGTDFALAPIEAAFDTGGTTIGMMVVAPDRQYPLHHHPPQELYLTIAGRGWWRSGGNPGYRPVGPIETVHNRPDDLHSVIAGDIPVVALYVLWP